MKIIIYSRVEILHDATELETLVNALIASGADFFVNADFADTIKAKTGRTIAPEKTYTSERDLPEDAQAIISYGGDGTFLDAVRLIDTRSIPVLGINSGRMGFLANVSKSDMAAAIEDMATGRYSLEKRILLEVAGDFGEKVHYPYAFNEFSIQKNGVTMVSVDVWVDGELITRYVGDGLLLSTPAGSTAYSLSVGGPIVSPDNNCFVLSPIASHNLTMRPLIIPDTCTLRFRVSSRMGSSFATLDNRNFKVPNQSDFTIKRAKKHVALIKLQNISFYRTLRDKMMWGIESRN